MICLFYVTYFMPHRMRFRIQFKKFGVRIWKIRKIKIFRNFVILVQTKHETGLGEDD